MLDTRAGVIIETKTAPMLKIAMISDAAFPFNKGGVEKRNWDVALRLRGRGYEVHMINARWPGMNRECVVEGINIHGVCRDGKFYVAGRRSILESVKFALGLMPHLLKNHYDVYACDQFPLVHIIPVRIITWLKRKELVLTWHEVWGKYWFDYLGWLGLVGYLVEKVAIRLPDKIISVSEQTTDALVGTLKVDRKNIQTIVNGIPFAYINSAPPSAESSDLIFVGRLLSHKNVDYLINAIEKIVKEYPDKPLRCLVVGDGPERQALEQLVSKKHLADRVVFKGIIERMDELYGLMKASKVFVLPSSREGFGITVIEAYACGLPVVTVDCDQNAARNLIQENQTGCLSKLESGALAEKIVFALVNHAAMKRNCVEFAKKYDWENLIDRLEQVYTKTD